MTGTEANCTVLVVEDEPIQRSNIVMIVEDIGCVALEAWNAARAIEVLGAHPEVRLVVTDIDMPGDMDGLRLAEHVRADDAEIDIIVTTAGLKPDTALLPVRTMFMPKPLDLDQLETAVRQLAAGRKTRSKTV